MKKINSEHLVAGCAITGIILLFGSFLFESAVYIAALILVVGIVTAILLCDPKRVSISFRSITSFMLCVAIVINVVLPVYATASESPGYSEKGNGRDLLTYLRDELALSVETYQLTPEMSDQELANVYLALDTQAAKAAWNNGNVLMEDAQDLSVEDTDTLLSEENTKLCLRFYNVLDQIVNSGPMTASVSGTENLPGTLSATSSGTPMWTITTDTITVSAESTYSSCEWKSTSATLTLTSSVAATLNVTSSTVEGGGTVTINGELVKSSYPLQENGTLTIVITSKSGEENTTSLTLSYEYIPSGGDVTISFQPVASIPYKVNGSTDVNTEAQSVTGDPAAGFTVIANDPHYVVTGATFVDADGNTTTLPAAEGKLSPKVSGTLTPIFEYDDNANGIAPFRVGTTTYWDWDEAMDAAASGDKLVVLNDDHTLVARDETYTIPSGVTLLIPYDSANTVITDTPSIVADLTTNYVTPYVYRTLTMADGAHITVTGSMSVAAQTAAPGAGYHLPNGGTYGPVGHVVMNKGSSITVNGGLYCYGYITGSGTVTAESESVVYERFEIADYRGGNASSSMNDDRETYKVFPISQYYIQNIEVPLTLKCGAEEYAWTAVDLSIGTRTTKLSMIGDSDDFMFGLSNGSVTKRYDPATDRQIYDVNGDMTLNHISIILDAGIFANVTIDSANFMLPITSSMTINIHSGTSTVKQALALLPEAQLTIDSGAKVVLEKDVHVYDLDEWLAGAYVYQNSSTPTATMRQARWRPGGIEKRTLANDGSIVVNGELVATTGELYTSTGGASITSTGTGKITMTAGTNGTAYQATQYGGNTVEYTGIPITPAQLKNADDSYVETTGNTAAMTYEYVRVDRVADVDGDGVEEVTDVAGHWHKTYTTEDGKRYRYFDIVATNIAVNDGLDLYFYVYDACPVDDAEYTAVVTKDFADGYTVNGEAVESVSEEFLSASWVTVEESGITYRRFKFADISAKEMTDNIQAIIYHDQLQVSSVLNETVRTYAIRTLKSQKNAIPTLTTALIDMLKYGAAAQKHFGYNTENLADSTGGTDDPDKIISTYIGSASKDATGDMAYTSELVKGDNFVATSVSAKNKFMYTFYFSNIDTTMTAKVSYTDHDGTEVTKTVNGEDFYKYNSWYGVDVEGLSIMDGRQLISCEVTNSEGAVVASGKDSVMGYVARNSNNNDDVYELLMKFVDSANAFFTRDNT